MFLPKQLVMKAIMQNLPNLLVRASTLPALNRTKHWTFPWMVCGWKIFWWSKPGTWYSTNCSLCLTWFTVDDDSFLSEFAERLKLDCAIFGKVNECCQKGKGSVRKDLSFTTTMDNLRRAKESERPNKTTSSPNSSGDQTYPNHQSEVAGDVDVDKGIRF